MKRDYPLRKGSYDGKLSEEIVEFVRKYNFAYNDDSPRPKKPAAEGAPKPVSEVRPTPADIRPSAAVEVRRPFSTEAPAAQPMKAASSTSEPEKNNKLLIVIAALVAAAGIGTAAAMFLHKDSEGGSTKKSKSDSSNSGAVTVSASSEGDPSEVEVIDSNDDPQSATDDSEDTPRQGNDTQAITTTTEYETVPVMETTTPLVPVGGDDTDTTTEALEPSPVSDEAPAPMNLTEYTLHYGSDTSSCWIVTSKVDAYGQALVDTNGNPIYVISEVPASSGLDNMKGMDVNLYQENGVWYLYYGIDNKYWAPYDHNTNTYVTTFNATIILAEDGEG